MEGGEIDVKVDGERDQALDADERRQAADEIQEQNDESDVQEAYHWPGHGSKS